MGLVTSGTITAIQWYYSGTTALPNSQDLSVYIGHTTKTEFTSTTDWEPIGNLTLSYTGGITIPTPGTNGWVTITLDTPFVYNGTSNLIVAVDENMPGFDATSDDFFNTSVTPNRSIRYISDTVNPDPASPPTGARTSFVPNIIFNGLTVSTAPNCTSLTTPVNGATNVNEEANLTWAAATGVPTGYFLSVGTSPGGSEIVSNFDNGNSTFYNLPSLTFGSTYYVRITPYNANGNATVCTEESFTVRAAPPVGQICGNPIVVGALPYNTVDNTNLYVDDYNGSPGSGCGSTSAYLGGDDVVYAYTATADTTINFAISGAGTYSGMFLYTSCSNIGTSCVAGAINGAAGGNFDFDYNVTNGQTYFVVISTWPTPQSTAYTLDIREVLCADPSGLAVANITTTTADLSWTDNNTTATSNWNLEVLLSGTTPTNMATNTTSTNSFQATGLTANMSYDYYVQADCGGGALSLWVGPFTFTTACNSITTYPSTTDFTNNPPTVCWDEAGDGEVAAGPSGLGTSDWRANRAYQDAGANVINSNAINLWQNVDREWLLSPTFTIPSGMDYALKVQVAVTDWNGTGTSTAGDTMGSDDEVQLLMTLDNGATWSTLETWNVGNQPSVNGTDFVADLTGITGDVQFAFWGSDGTVDNAEDYDFHVGAFTVDLLSVLSTEEFNTNNLDFSYFPNPVSNEFTINAATKLSSVSVINVLGQIVYSTTPNTNKVIVNMSELNAGYYFVKVVSGNASKTIKVIKN